MRQRVPILEKSLPPDPEHLLPGSFFLRRIEGWTGRWVGAAQAFTRGGSNWTHAGLVLDNYEIIEAAPGGARIKQVEGLWDSEPVLISDAPVQRWAAENYFPEDFGFKEEAIFAKRVEICGKARFLEGTPYSFLDYAALGMAEFKVPGWQLVRNRVEDSKHLICSALVDRAYSWCGVHLFDDNRLPGDVTPWDLEQYVLRWEAQRMTDIAKAQGIPTFWARAGDGEP